MKHLQWLRDRIISSEVHTPQAPFLKSVQKVSQNIGDLISLGAQLEALVYRPEVTLNVVDFDDTLYSRYSQLQLPEFQDNRGEAGNTLIREQIRFRNFIERFYTRSWAVQRILWVVESQTTKHKSLILTAGVKELQDMKVDSIQISRKDVPVVSVSDSKAKPRMMVFHIIHRLWYKPGKIIIYEDRPECFEKEMPALRQLFPHTEIVIDKVTLNPPGNVRQIAAIEQSIYPKVIQKAA